MIHNTLDLKKNAPNIVDQSFGVYDHYEGITQQQCHWLNLKNLSWQGIGKRA